MRSRWIHFVLAGLLLITAALQLNDPDPVYWVLVYGFGGAAAAAMAFDRSSRLTLGVLIGGVLAGMLESAGGVLSYLASADPASIFGSMSPDKPWVEPAREFLGLAMLLGLLLWYLRLNEANKKM